MRGAEGLVADFPGAKRVLVGCHIDPLAAKADALKIKTKPLLERGVSAQLDFTVGADDALPWQRMNGLFA